MADRAEAPPKYLAVADALLAQMADGEWEGGRLPSVRGIAAAHGVSVVTASRALQILRDKGMVQTVARSGCYRVPPADADRWAVCLHLTPGTWHAATDRLTRQGFDQLARRRPMVVDYDAVEAPPGLTPADAADAAHLAREKGVKGVFLLPSRVSEEAARAEAVLIAACRRAGMPTVLLERNLRSQTHLACDLAAQDDVGAAQELTRHLLALGRRRIGLAVGSPASSHHDRLAGYLLALQLFAAENPAADAAPHVLYETPAAAPGLADRVVRDRLDAVVCYSDYCAVAVIVELLQRGRRVPRDVAVTGFDDLPVGNLFAAGLTTHEYPTAALAEQAVRLMRARLEEPDRPFVKVSVPGRVVVRGSTRLEDPGDGVNP